MLEKIFLENWRTYKSPVHMFYRGNCLLMIYPGILLSILFMVSYMYLIIYQPKNYIYYLFLTIIIYYSLLYLNNNWRNQKRLKYIWPELDITINPFRFWNSKGVNDFRNLSFERNIQSKLFKYSPKRRKIILDDIDRYLLLQSEKADKKIFPFTLLTITIAFLTSFGYHWMDSLGGTIKDKSVVLILAITMLLVSLIIYQAFSSFAGRKKKMYLKMRLDLHEIRQNHLTFKTL